MRARQQLKKAVRAYFEAAEFSEAECGILQHSPGNETHIHAFSTTAFGPEGTETRLYLHTSPELACKKLLAAGEKRLYTLGAVFRNRDRGPLHAPEFTMLEWYRANSFYDAIMADTIVVIARAAQATGIGQFRFRGKVCDPFAEPELITVADAFQRFAGVDLLTTIAGGAGRRAWIRLRWTARR